MDLYPILRQVIKAEFGSIYRFCKDSGLPPATVKHLILGNLGMAAEIKARQKVDEAIRRLRPHVNLNGAWARQEPREKNNLIVEVPEDAKTVRINFTVTMSFE